MQNINSFKKTMNEKVNILVLVDDILLCNRFTNSTSMAVKAKVK